MASPIPRSTMPRIGLSDGALGMFRLQSGGKIGAAIAESILGAERRKNDAETQSTQETTLDLLRRAQLAEEVGNMQLHDEIVGTLDGMLTGLKNNDARKLITDGLAAVNRRRAATQANSTTNAAMGILRTQAALEDLDSIGPLSDNQITSKQILQERLQQLQQNGAAVTEASTIQYTTELNALTRQEKLRSQRGKAVIAALSSVEKGSERYNQIVERANTLKLGKFVKDFEKAGLELERLDIEVAKIRDEDPRKPLTAEQKERLAATGYKSSGDPARDRKEFIRLIEAEAKAARAISLRDITEVTGDEARALARQALRDIQREPGADLSGNIFDDLSEEIDDLSDEELQELYDLSQGKTPVEIRQISVDWTRDKFLDEFEDMLQVQENEARELDEARDAIDAVIAASNAKSGAKPGDANYKDPNDPLVRNSALERLKSDASKQRALMQAEGVGGRVL